MIENILIVINYFLTFFVEYISLSDICKIKYKINFKIISIIVCISVINYFATFSSVYLVKSFISFLSLFFLILVNTRNQRKSAIASLIYFIYMVIIEFFASLILVNVLKYDPSKYIVSVGIQKCIVSAIILFILYLICKVKWTNYLYNKCNNIFEKLGVKDFHIAVTFIMISLISTFYIVNVAGETKFVFSILFILIFISLIIMLFSSTYRNYYLKVFNGFLQGKDDEYQKLIDEYKMFKHNMRHELELISVEGNNKVKKMINEYLLEFAPDMQDIRCLTDIPKGFKGLIYQKLFRFSKNDYKIYIDNLFHSDPIELLSIKKYNKFVQSFGIILDNAVESLDSAPDGYLYLLLTEDESEYIIKCVNTFNKNINIDSFLEKGKSTKKNHEGIGLYYIKNKTNFPIEFLVRDDLFIVTLKVKK